MAPPPSLQTGSFIMIILHTIQQVNNNFNVLTLTICVFSQKGIVKPHGVDRG